MLSANDATIHSFRVIPDLPEPLKPLLEIANNLWWTWHPEAVKLFTRLDRELWEDLHHNPVKMLGLLDQQTLDRFANDRSFLAALNDVHARFAFHNERTSWFEREYNAQCSGTADDAALRIAYFSAEFGLTECYQIYSGGLGLLAGDHLKSASEMGIPLCAVGLLYRCGYFHQYLNADGWQQERYPDIDAANQPVRRVRGEDGSQLKVTVQLPGREVAIGIWQTDVGRVPLYLLDTNMPENSPEDRDITRTLYGGDVEHRIKQEIVLGIGGVRALKAVGEKPNVWHINEGHAAFLNLERIANIREEHGVSFEEAKEAAAGGNVFTTHTPVPAGIDRFAPSLVEKYFAHDLPRLGLNLEGFLGLGRSNPFDHEEFFSMAVLAIRGSQFANGVSKLHGEVSRNMWRGIWPGLPEHEVPIGHVTNGVHPRSWVCKDLASMFDRYVTPDWQLDPRDHDIWERVNLIPDEEIWAFRNTQRQRLVTWLRGRIRDQLSRRGWGQTDIERRVSMLDPDTFTVGFARRFATYKRGNLLLRDVDRLRRMFESADRPIQIIVAGKAHPADGPGKSLIQQIEKFANESAHRHRIFFLEDYDIDIARRLVQGCDVWLNTPRRGMEASGTSGMKAAMNGVINVSILDGWWDEAYEPNVGYAIGHGEEYDDPAQADEIEASALYDLFERQILPEFYTRSDTGMPMRWIQRVKTCIRDLLPQFSTNRMVADYAEQFYLRAYDLQKRLAGGGIQQATELSIQIHRLREYWHSISIDGVQDDGEEVVSIRGEINVVANITLGALRPEEVSVQIYHGSTNALGDLDYQGIVDMQAVEGDSAEGRYVYKASFCPDRSGMAGYTVRVVPKDERLVGTVLPGLITWHRVGKPGDVVDEPAELTEATKAAV